MSADNDYSGIDFSTLTDEEREAIQGSDMTDAEVEAMRRVAAGDDSLPPVAATTDDDDDADPAGADPVDPVDPDPAEDGTAAADAAAAAADKAAAKAAAAQAEDDTDEAPDQGRAPTYKAELPSDYADRTKALADADSSIKEQFRNGDIDFEEFEIKRAELLVEREALTMMRAKAEISAEMTAQTTQNTWRDTVLSFNAACAKAPGGVDYSKDTEKQADLDQFLKVLAAREENANKSMGWFLSEAHKRVIALHGLPATAAGAGKDAVANAVKARKVSPGAAPANLANVPGSDGPGDLGGEFANLDKLEGEAQEEAIARMTPAQRARWAAGQ